MIIVAFVIFTAVALSAIFFFACAYEAARKDQEWRFVLYLWAWVNCILIIEGMVYHTLFSSP